MSEEGRKCPSCWAPLKPGSKFCPSCGKKVVADGPASAPGVRTVGAQTAGAQRLPSVPLGGGYAAPSPVAPCGDAADAQTVSFPAPFELAVALPEAMQVGRRSNVEVRFRAHADLYESVTFVLRCGVSELARLECVQGRPSVSEHRTVVPVTPKVCGDACLSLDVICRLDGKVGAEVHSAQFTVPVEAQKAQPVFNFEVGDINISSTTGHAADAKIDLGGLHVNLPSSQEDDQKDKDDRYQTRTDFMPLTTQLKESPSRLTLQCGDEALQLLSDETVTFGRSRETTVPFRIFGKDGRVDGALNRDGCQAYLSSFQFSLERSGEDCILRDGVVGGKASNGVRMDGDKLHDCETKRLSAGRATELNVGFEGHGLGLRVTFHRDRLGCADGFVLDRLDGARQRVCAVWKTLPIGGNERVRWDGCRWHLLRGDTADIPLAVGTTVSIGGRTFTVQPFHKTHLN